jgi:aspartate kinase
MQNSAISFNVCVNDTDDKVDRFAARIKEQFKVVIERGLELYTVRHYQEDVLANLRRGKMVLIEERTTGNMQMVVKDLPVMQRRAVPLPSAKDIV